MEPPAKLLVVDDHKVVSEGLELLCASRSDVSFVGSASTVDGALIQIERTGPDVVLVDLNLPPDSGLDLIREIRKRWPAVRPVVLSVEKNEETVLDAMQVGAAGYLTKDLGVTEILEAVARAALGETVIEGISPGKLLQRFVTLTQEAASAAQAMLALSAREREVLGLVAEGKTNQQIASALGISDRTVATHVASIYRKLQITNRVEAAREANRLGLAGP
jgi:RNA polymerase sigma factor (sigma-70 family)